MTLWATKKKRKCQKCAGYGAFIGKERPFILGECPACSSIHPEQLALRYEKEGENYHFYLTPPLVWCFKHHVRMLMGEGK